MVSEWLTGESLLLLLSQCCSPKYISLRFHQPNPVQSPMPPVRTVSSVNSGQGARGLAHHDGRVRVVLLHGGVGALEERPIERISLIFVRSSALQKETYLVGALCCEVWQKRKRSSFRPLVKTYLEDMVSGNSEGEDKREERATPPSKRTGTRRGEGIN